MTNCRLFLLFLLTCALFVQCITAGGAYYLQYKFKTAIPVESFNSEDLTDPYQKRVIWDSFFTYSEGIRDYFDIHAHTQPTYFSDRKTIHKWLSFKSDEEMQLAKSAFEGEVALQFGISMINEGCGFEGNVIVSATSKAVQLPDRCFDGMTNGDETDVDCGGTDCPPCDLDQKCLTNKDCGASNTPCINGVCHLIDSTHAPSVFIAFLLAIISIALVSFFQ